MNNRPGGVSAGELARYVIWYAEEKHVPITQLKLQKLLYFIQMEYIQRRGALLFDDPIEAWAYGPVVRDVYYDYCAYGSLPLYSDSEDDGNIHLPKEDVDLINDVLDSKMRYAASRLVRDSHAETPWRKHKDEVNGGGKPVITREELLSTYKR